MAHIGYHVSHEQFKPSELLKYVQMAEQAGFTRALSSDHLDWLLYSLNYLVHVY